MHAQQTERLKHRLRPLVFPSVIVIDEIGYLPTSRTGEMTFFRLMSRRHKHTATILTSNSPFEDWGEVFGGEMKAATLETPRAFPKLLHLATEPPAIPERFRPPISNGVVPSWPRRGH